LLGRIAACGSRSNPSSSHRLKQNACREVVGVFASSLPPERHPFAPGGRIGAEIPLGSRAATSRAGHARGTHGITRTFTLSPFTDSTGATPTRSHELPRGHTTAHDPVVALRVLPQEDHGIRAAKLRHSRVLNRDLERLTVFLHGDCLLALRVLSGDQLPATCLAE